jgi:Tfp pilus assembly protein PilX
MNGSLVRRHGSEAGIALPMTLILMALITSLTVAFLAFTSAEPVIASNQMANAQARAIAESGVERALWALSKGETLPSPVGALADPLPAPVPAPYDGSQYVAVGFGEFKVTVTNGAATNERNITAVGFVPNHTNPIAIKKIQTTVTHIKIPTPPCAICAGGEQPAGTSTEIRIGGSASISASLASGAVYCAGSVPTAAAYAQGAINTNGNPNVTGPTPVTALAQNQPNTAFDFLFNNADFNTLRAYARSLGPDHYYQGSVTWTSPPPNGIIVVDTLSGDPLSPSSPSGDAASVDIHGNWSSGWSGWLIVAGTIQISGNTTLSGLIYAQNDVQLHGTGGGSVTGAVVSTNRVDSSSTNIDTDDTGNAPVSYNCPAVRNGGGAVPINWFVKPGTFREVAGS